MTAKHVLRRADVATACAAAGIPAPERVRSAADVPDLHYPWAAALAVGLLSVEGNRVGPGPALAGWRSATDDDVLAGWSRGLAGALADTYGEDDRAHALEIGRLVLTVLATDPPPTSDDLPLALVETLIAARHTLWEIVSRGFGIRHPVDVAMELLAAFGPVDGSDGRWRITPLKVTLRYVRPACWRRILVPADVTLGDLHEVIRIAFAWDDDHLHLFSVGPRQYGDPGFDFEHDEDEITLSAALARSRKPMRHIYDLGAHWEHEIILEKAVEPDPYPLCIDGCGDAPRGHGEQRSCPHPRGRHHGSPTASKQRSGRPREWG